MLGGHIPSPGARRRRKSGKCGRFTWQNAGDTREHCHARVAKIVFSRQINNFSRTIIFQFAMYRTQKRRPSGGGTPQCKKKIE